MHNRQWVLKSRPTEQFKLSDFEEQTEEMPLIKEGQALLKTLYLSFDPTQRGWAAIDTYMPAVPLGGVMRAMGIGQVIESQHKKFKKGDLVAGLTGWQEYCLIDSQNPQLLDFFVVPPYIDAPLILALSLTGLTAYFGMKKIGKPKVGQTVLVSGAAGATGSIAGQLAKIKGARVIGIAGGQEKCRWLKEVGHFDEAIDYKSEEVETRLGELCPKGIDVYFDNVGGEILDAALLHLAPRARVVVCGQISQYDKINPNGKGFTSQDTYGVRAISMLILQRAKIEGFLVADYKDQFVSGMLYLHSLVEQKKLVQEMDIQEGFQNIPKTLIRMFEGKNIGKQLLKLSDPVLPLNTSTLGRWLFRGFEALIKLAPSGI